jgi:quercetin dioxygenase-like cupin family protein
MHILQDQYPNIFFPKSNLPPIEHFDGNAWVKSLVPAKGQSKGADIHVLPEKETNDQWHKHPVEQMLIAAGGAGYYHEKDKPFRILSEGDVVFIPADVEHKHTPGPGSEFTHVIIYANNQKQTIITWLMKVMD